MRVGQRLGNSTWPYVTGARKCRLHATPSTSSFVWLGAMDPDGVAALFAETIDWYVPAASDLPWTGHRSRRANVPDYFHTMWSHFHLEKSQVKLDQLLMEGEDAVAFGTFSHVTKTTEQPFTTPFALHLKIKDGAITALQP
jgi:ketosteroid isomerase-like protein